MKLNLGSQGDYRDGWINIDKDGRADLHEDIFTYEKFDDNSITAILLNHVAMYIKPELFEKLLKRWHGWLKEDGTIHIETQDLNKIHTPELLYGMGKNAGHKWGWTPSTIKEQLQKAGFKNITVMPGILHGWPDRDFLISGTKLYEQKKL